MYGFEEYDFGIVEYSIEDVRDDLNNLVAYFRSAPDYRENMETILVKTRGLDESVIDMSEAFYVPEDIIIDSLPEWMLQESIGFIKGNWIPMLGRCVFPVKDVNGDVMGLCGWDPFVDPKYLDSKNYGYKAKSTSLFGMENMREYYTSKEPVFVTEGLMCALYLRSKGFNALATLGSYMTTYVITILSRFGNRLIMIPDNDETGDKYVKQIKKRLPKAMVVQCKYGKDIEGFRKLDEYKYEEQLLRELKSLSNPFVRTELLIRR